MRGRKVSAYLPAVKLRGISAPDNDHYGMLRTDNVRRAIPLAPHWFSFVKFNHLAVIDICARSPLSRLDISRERIR